MVPFTLWRGDLCVGEVVATLPAQAEFAVVGLYRRKADGGVPRSLIQARILASGGVFLSPLPKGRRPGPHPVRPLPADEASGLPLHQQLRLRDGAGDVVEVDVLMIYRDSVPAGSGPFPDFCRAHGFPDEVDVLTAWRHADRGPDTGSI